jgi:hypothetical protein
MGISGAITGCNVNSERVANPSSINEYFVSFVPT